MRSIAGALKGKLGVLSALVALALAVASMGQSDASVQDHGAHIHGNNDALHGHSQSPFESKLEQVALLQAKVKLGGGTCHVTMHG